MANLIISKTSWHFWLYSKACDFFSKCRYDPKTLCAYFWSWVFTVSCYAFMLAFICALLGVLTLGIPLLLWSWLHNGSSGAKEVLEVIAAMTVGVALIGGIAVGATELGVFIETHTPPPGEEKTLTGLGVVWGYIVATKRKVCPFIEYR